MSSTRSSRLDTLASCARATSAMAKRASSAMTALRMRMPLVASKSGTNVPYRRECLRCSQWLREGFAVQPERNRLAERSERARHHVDGAPRRAGDRTRHQQRDEHVFAMQRTVRAHVWNRLVSRAKIPVARGGENDLPRA